MPSATRGRQAPTDKPDTSLATYLRGLPYMHPDRQKYHRLTLPGSAPGSAPRTVAQLRAARVPFKPHS